MDADLLNTIVGAASLDGEGRRVLPPARFDDSMFTEPAVFAGIVISPDTSFDRVTFAEGADFAEATFSGQARFGAATFGADTSFERTQFKGHGWFAAAQFAADTTFRSATFAGPAWFGGAHFDGDATFEQARFAGDASFEDCSFGCHTFFARACFGGAARFSTTSFANVAQWDDAEFRGPGGAPSAAARRAVWTGAELASWPRRAGAALVDHSAALALVTAGAISASALRALHYDGPATVVLVLGAVAAALFVTRNLVIQGYTGQTVGKRIAGLCLVRQRDGLPVGPVPSLARAGAHLLDTVPLLVGWAWPLWDRNRQTFADKVLRTVVVRGRGWASPTVAAAEARREVVAAFG